MSQTTVTMELGEDFIELRESIHKVCEKYPLDYWAKLEEKSAYPTEFVNELTEGGFLSLIHI